MVLKITEGSHPIYETTYVNLAPAQVSCPSSPHHKIGGETLLSDLFFKAREERLEEGIGDQIDDGLPRTGSGVLQGA